MAKILYTKDMVRGAIAHAQGVDLASITDFQISEFLENLETDLKPQGIPAEFDHEEMNLTLNIFVDSCPFMEQIGGTRFAFCNHPNKLSLNTDLENDTRRQCLVFGVVSDGDLGVCNVAAESFSGKFLRLL